MVDNKIPAAVQSAFERTEHPFFMWEGIQDVPLGAEVILSEKVREQIHEAAVKMQGKKNVDLIGCGTSYFAGIAATYTFHALTSLSAYAYNAFEYFAYSPKLSNENILIGISHTGGTPDIVRSVEKAKQHDEYTIGYTDVENSALDRSADITIQSALGAEPALPKTRSYISALMRNNLIALELAKLEGKDVSNLENQISAIPEKLRLVMEETHAQAEKVANDVKDARKFIIVGGGPQWATAKEGSLKLTEAALVISDAWELEEAVHGTWASTGEGDVVVILAMQGASYEKSVILAEGMKTIGCTVWVITDKADAAIQCDYLTVLPQGLDELFLPVTAIVPLYYFTYFLSLAHDLRPDNMNLIDPRYLKARQLMRTSMK